MPRVPKKTLSLTCRITPEVKESLALAADAERRSLAGMLEVMVLEWCKRHRVRIKSGNRTNKA